MKPWVHIIGGGLAGLSLASELGRFKKLPGDVIISEPNPSNLEKRTFSYWFQEFERPMLHLTIQQKHGDWALAKHPRTRLGGK